MPLARYGVLKATILDRRLATTADAHYHLLAGVGTVSWRVAINSWSDLAPSEVAQKERFRRTEGALAATQAALSEGVVPGGGTALLRSAGALDGLSLEGDYARGAEIIRDVLSEHGIRQLHDPGR